MNGTKTVKGEYFVGRFKSFFVLLFFVFLSTACERFVGTSISEKDAATPTNERQSLIHEELPTVDAEEEKNRSHSNNPEENEKCTKTEKDLNSDLNEVDCANSPTEEEKSPTKLSDQ